MGNSNKRKGSNAERLYAQKFRDLGFTKCRTSREVSKLLDDSKVDLAFTPGINVQIKAGFQKAMRPAKVLYEMGECLKENYPEQDPLITYPRIVIHHKQGIRGKKRTPEMDLVFFHQRDFILLIDESKYALFVYHIIKIENGIICCTFDIFTECLIKKLKKQ